MEKQSFVGRQAKIMVEGLKAALGIGGVQLEGQRRKPGKVITKDNVFENVTNYSRATRLAQALSCTMRVRVSDDGGVVLYEEDDTKEVMGKGKTFADAFRNATRDLSVREILDLAGPTLRSLDSLDLRLAAERMRALGLPPMLSMPALSGADDEA